jgi:uncharacterized protein YuzE
VIQVAGSLRWSVLRGILVTMKIDGHYDPQADIAWLRFEGYEPATVVTQEIATGLREIDPANGHIVVLECWHASQTLPSDLLAMLPPPKAASAA